MASPLDEHYQRILDMAEPDLRTLYPFGIVPKGNKWVPARRGDAARKLSRLLADKEARQVEPPMLGTSGGYTTDPRFALGKRRRHAGEFGEPEPAAPYPDEVAKMGLKAREDRSVDRHDEVVENQALVIATKIAKVQREGLKLGVDLGPQFQQFIREAQAGLRERREAAA